MKDCKNPLSMVAWVLLLVGGLNWGLVAINREWDLVHMVLGEWMAVETVVYALVGLSAVWMLVKWAMGSCKK